jgi:hypothetical protein
MHARRRVKEIVASPQKRFDLLFKSGQLKFGKNIERFL